MYMQNCEELLKYHPLFEALRILGLHKIVLGMHVPPLKMETKLQLQCHML